MGTIAATMKSAEQWAGVVADLAVKRKAAEARGAELRKRKADLSLEAALGSAQARKELEKLNAELTKLTFDCDDLGVAVQQAESEKVKAAKESAVEAERQRRAEMSRFAKIAVKHAADFTRALQQAAKAASAVKASLGEMQGLATADENRALNPLLRPQVFMRGAEHVGLRSCLEFQPYPGPPAQIVALETELGSALEHWLEGGR